MNILCELVAESARWARFYLGFNDVIYKLNSTNEKVLYLTFDDGPTYGVTDWVLKTLDRYQAKATFFLLGKNVEQLPYYYERILAEGHSVGNHSYSHIKGFSASVEEYKLDVLKAKILINSNLFRPPYGRITRKQVKAVKGLGFKIILWTVVSCDYERKFCGDVVYRIVKKRIAPGSIIVFHDSLKAEQNMKYAVERLLYEYQGEYEFRAIPFSKFMK